MAEIKHINSLQEFDAATAKGKTFVDFYADWCGPCKMLAPFFQELATETEGVNFVKVDVDNAQELAAKFGVQSIPTLMVVEDGEVKSQKAGFMPKNMMAELIK